MTPDVFRAFFRGGIFVALIGLLLTLSVPPNSAEFVVSVCSTGIGVALIALVLIANWWTGR